MYQIVSSVVKQVLGGAVGAAGAYIKGNNAQKDAMRKAIASRDSGRIQEQVNRRMVDERFTQGRAEVEDVLTNLASRGVSVGGGSPLLNQAKEAFAETTIDATELRRQGALAKTRGEEAYKIYKRQAKDARKAMVLEGASSWLGGGR